MCGIITVFDKKQKIIKSEIEKLRDLMVHRGPDDAGIFIKDSLALAHRRLSILDLSPAGHQPMSMNNNWIVFNGEIYNFIELAKENNIDLKDNHSDTYVLLNLLNKYGSDILNKLNGMWGFAYYDNKKEELLISRDRFGKKPLYYYEDSNVFMVSSEIKPILYSKYYKKEINQNAVDEYLKTGLVDGLEETFFKGIKRFPSAHYGIYSLKEKKFKIKRYYSIEESIYAVSNDEKENIAKFKELFFDAVKIRLRSDVEVGTCLSGGLDSSSIYCVASELSDKPIQSFSSRFKEKGYDEGYFIEQVIKKYPGKNHFVFPEYDNFESKLRNIIYYLEEPSKAMGVYPQWHVMELASKHLKVLLDGQGGDEILAGYDPYYSSYLADIKNPIKFFWEVLKIIDKKGIRISKSLAKGVLSRYVKGKKEFQNSYLATKLLYDVYRDMLPALIKYEDKIGMAFSIEARMPFLDYRLVNFIFSLENKYKIRNGWNKWILRKAMKGILPDEVAYRKDKKGFPTPFNKILEQNRHLEKYIPSGVNDEWQKWRYVSFGIWKEMFFGKGKDKE
jgi:asparagine synthase (glutamine-hydrolysing)